MSKHQIQAECGESDAGRVGRTCPREAKFSGSNGDREKLTFPVQLTMSRIGNRILLIHTLSSGIIVSDYDHTYIQTHNAGRPGGSVGNLETF